MLPGWARKAAGAFLLCGTLAFLSCGCAASRTAAGIAGADPKAAHTSAPAGADDRATFDAELLGEARRAGKWGLRAGYVLSGPGEIEDFSGGLVVGTFYQGAQLKNRNVVYEVGFDYIPITSSSGYVSSNLFLLRADALFARWSEAGARPLIYFLGGAHVVIESAKDEISGDTYALAEVGADIGVGYGSLKQGWCTQITCAILLGSENLGSLTLFTASYAF